MTVLIPIAGVCRKIGRSPSTIRRYLDDPGMNFPRPVALGPRDRGWLERELEEWIAARPRLDAPRLAPDTSVAREGENRDGDRA